MEEATIESRPVSTRTRAQRAEMVKRVWAKSRRARLVGQNKQRNAYGGKGNHYKPANRSDDEVDVEVVDETDYLKRVSKLGDRECSPTEVVDFEEDSDDSVKIIGEKWNLVGAGVCFNNVEDGDVDEGLSAPGLHGCFQGNGADVNNEHHSSPVQLVSGSVTSWEEDDNSSDENFMVDDDDVDDDDDMDSVSSDGLHMKRDRLSKGKNIALESEPAKHRNSKTSSFINSSVHHSYYKKKIYVDQRYLQWLHSRYGTNNNQVKSLKNTNVQTLRVISKKNTNVQKESFKLDKFSRKRSWMHKCRNAGIQSEPKDDPTYQNWRDSFGHLSAPNYPTYYKNDVGRERAMLSKSRNVGIESVPESGWPGECTSYANDINRSRHRARKEKNVIVKSKPKKFGNNETSSSSLPLPGHCCCCAYGGGHGKKRPTTNNGAKEEECRRVAAKKW